MAQRKAIPIATVRLVLHECGYKCGNPACRGIITLDIHHIEYVAEGGGNGAENLLPLCPLCHALHHADQIPRESIRAWKMLLLSLNDGFSRSAVDLLLALDHLGRNPVLVTTDTVLGLGSLIASDLITIEHPTGQSGGGGKDFYQTRFVSLSPKGSAFVTAWKAGDQKAAIESTGQTPMAPPRPTDDAP